MAYMSVKLWQEPSWLAALVEAQTGNRPYVPDTLYLFCGRRTDRIKGLVWEGDGWLLLYKRLSGSCFQKET